MHCSAYIATSLDGFIARPNGDLDWLDAAQATVTPGEDCGYAEYMANIDAIVMGRNTYEKVRSFTPWPYNKPVYVLSNHWSALPEDAPPSVELFKGSCDQLVDKLSTMGRERVYIDGGKTIQSFISAGLLDEITITTIPVLLGSGLSLFGGLTGDVRLDHLQTQSWAFGFVQSRYRLNRGV